MISRNWVGGILLMGGAGLRFGSTTPKQFHRLSGKPLFLYALETFIKSNFFDEIVICCHPDWIDYASQWTPPYDRPIHLIPGGATRQESSYRALLGFEQKPDIVLIHDAARPFVSREILEQNLLFAEKHGAVDTCIPAQDTLVFAPLHTQIEEIPRRSDYQQAQTPQTFFYDLILQAHAQTRQTNATDDCQLVLELDHEVHIVTGSPRNFKVTSEIDLLIAEQLLRIPGTSLTHFTNDISLVGKLYAVVGGTGGIGHAIVQQIEAAGGTCLSLARFTSIPLNLEDPSSIENAFRQIHNTYGPLDGLINCAGYLIVNPLERLSLQEIEKLLDVNLKGLILCCKSVFLKNSAHLINIASSAFSLGRKEATVYAATKAAVVNFSQGLAEELPHLFIHAVVPQRTNTAMRKTNFPFESEEELLDPKQIAQAVVYLLGEQTKTGLLVEVRKK